MCIRDRFWHGFGMILAWFWHDCGFFFRHGSGMVPETAQRDRLWKWLFRTILEGWEPSCVAKTIWSVTSPKKVLLKAKNRERNWKRHFYSVRQFIRSAGMFRQDICWSGPKNIFIIGLLIYDRFDSFKIPSLKFPPSIQIGSFWGPTSWTRLIQGSFRWPHTSLR